MKPETSECERDSDQNKWAKSNSANGWTEEGKKKSSLSDFNVLHFAPSALEKSFDKPKYNPMRLPSAHMIRETWNFYMLKTEKQTYRSLTGL